MGKHLWWNYLEEFVRIILDYQEKFNSVLNYMKKDISDLKNDLSGLKPDLSKSRISEGSLG